MCSLDAPNFLKQVADQPMCPAKCVWECGSVGQPGIASDRGWRLGRAIIRASDNLQRGHPKFIVPPARANQV